MDMDFLLTQKMRMGDEKAVEAFVTKYYAQILRYCRLHIGDYGYAEDAAQETFERFFRNFGQYRHYGRAANFLYVIAANVCRDFYRKNREIPLEDLSEEADLSAEGMDLQIELRQAFARLPEELRQIGRAHV